MAPSTVPLIKGYLPVRLMLPPTWSESYNDETYFYVREHRHKGEAANDENNNNKATLFVANAPIVPGISTRILLSNLFGRFANVSRVTVIQNPRGGNGGTTVNGKELTTTATTTTSFWKSSWTDKFQNPSGLAPVHSEGKFAHVVFATPKDLKKVMKALQEVMQSNSTNNSNKKNSKSTSARPGLTLDRIEIQTLSDETSRQCQEAAKQQRQEDDDDDDDEDRLATDSELTGIHAVAARYRASYQKLDRKKLLEECNAVMEAYEQAEEEKRKSQEAARSQPDDDGFVTVSYSTAVGNSEFELEEEGGNNTNTPARRKGNKRSRKRKEAIGSKELQDFYRFQHRENKKRSLQELRERFEEDLQRVKRMKEEHHYKPF